VLEHIISLGLAKELDHNPFDVTHEMLVHDGNKGHALHMQERIISSALHLDQNSH